MAIFKDKINLEFQAGKGGDGGVYFSKSRKPSGGIGGDGGNIYVEGTTNLFDYRNFTQNRIYKAENGQAGGRNNKTGRNGKDTVIKIPIASMIYDEDNNLILEIKNDKERQLLAKGGRGGVGNFNYRGGGVAKLEMNKPGEKGENVKTFFELELISQVIFIGMPNAGKSSVLNVLSEARPKIADYAFTTLTPLLGMGRGITMMDLPGLIEGTFEGKGLGTGFVKHTRRCKIVAHFVSLTSKDILADYKVIRKEIKKIDSLLYEKPEILILTKSDELDSEEVDKLETDIRKHFGRRNNKPIEIIVASILDDKAMKNLMRAFKNKLK